MDAATSSPARILTGRASPFAAMQMDLGRAVIVPWSLWSIAHIRREHWPDVELPETNASAEES